LAKQRGPELSTLIVAAFCDSGLRFDCARFFSVLAPVYCLFLFINLSRNKGLSQSETSDTERVTCEFQVRCRKIAVEKDDLSLLAGISAKERQKLPQPVGRHHRE